MLPRERVSQSALIALLTFGAGSTGADIPDDPDFALQWGFRNTGQVVDGQVGLVGADVDAPAAWGLHRGTSSVVVAIVGSGVDPHPEFTDRLLEGYATIGDPFDSLDGCPQDTYLAGIVAAATDNGVGMAGLNGFARVLPVRVLDDCDGTEASTAQGIIRAVDDGADVVLVSVQFFDGTKALAEAVAYAADHDVVVVAPAGNAGNEQVAFPAAFDGCLAVTATTNQDTLSSFSNYGPQVDIAAPGSYIWSTQPGGGCGYLEPGKDAAAAAAFVAGAAALVRSYAPQLDAAEVARVLVDSAVDIGEPGWDMRFGAGRVNARRALTLASAPALRFEHVGPLPDLLPPGQIVSFQIRVVGVAESVVAGSVALYQRIDSSAFVRMPLTPLGGELFLVELPAVACGSTLEYYLLAVGDGDTEVTDPHDAPSALYSADAVIRQEWFADDFEDDLGWEVEGGDNASGCWSRVIPVGTSAQPGYDFSPDGGAYCYVTGQHFGGHDGTNDVDGGPVRLVSPIIELGAWEAEVTYARWFHCSGAGEEDHLIVELSRDGGDTWVTVETVSSTDAWVVASFRLSEFPEVMGNQLRVRFTTADLLNDSLTEAAVDEFRVTAIRCSLATGDGNGDGVVDLRDFASMADCLAGPAVAIPTGVCDTFDFDADGYVDLSDYQAFRGVFAPQ